LWVGPHFWIRNGHLLHIARLAFLREESYARRGDWEHVVILLRIGGSTQAVGRAQFEFGEAPGIRRSIGTWDSWITDRIRRANKGTIRGMSMASFGLL